MVRVQGGPGRRKGRGEGGGDAPAPPQQRHSIPRPTPNAQRVAPGRSLAALLPTPAPQHPGQKVILRRNGDLVVRPSFTENAVVR